jgi:hypothetical protein
VFYFLEVCRVIRVAGHQTSSNSGVANEFELYLRLPSVPVQECRGVSCTVIVIIKHFIFEVLSKRPKH